MRGCGDAGTREGVFNYFTLLMGSVIFNNKNMALRFLVKSTVGIFSLKSLTA